MPRQTRPSRVIKSARLPKRLVEDVERRCAAEQINFTDAVESGLRLWLDSLADQPDDD